MKVIAKNKKAYHNYEILQTFEAGISLKGYEVKSIRAGKVSIKESFGRLENKELFIYDMHITVYGKSGYATVDPKRVRKLLFHKSEIKKIASQLTIKGHTFIPLRVYINDNGLVKLALGLAKGKRLFDKREAIKQKQLQREVEKKIANSKKRRR